MIDKLKYVLAILLFVAAGHTLLQSFMMSQKSQEMKYDLATLNNAEFGLFNVEVWKTDLRQILVEEISSFQLTGENREVVKEQIESLLETLLVEVEANIFSEKDGLFNKLKGMLVDVVIDFGKIKEKIPDYADAILKDLDNEENMAKLKVGLLSKMDELIEEVELTKDVSGQFSVLEKYGEKNIKACDFLLTQQIKDLQSRVWLYTGLGIFFILILWIVMLASGTNKFDYYILALSCLFLLAGGLFLPMMDLQAGLKQINFILLGHELNFENQVLFFQSKSIIQVVQTLIKAGTFNGILVGLLILVFSILFPLAKILASMLYIIKSGIMDSKLGKWLVFNSGKWSMADVFVVAAFMAFLGFSGVIDSQLSAIPQNQYISSISFNATTFQPGFTWFIAFCLSGLFFSTAIKRLEK